MKTLLRRVPKFSATAVLAFAIAVNTGAVIAAGNFNFHDPPSKAPLSSVVQTSPQGQSLEELGKSLRKLTAEVELLAKRVTDLEKERLFDVTRVLLSSEEQRAESLQAKLGENIEKQKVLQARFEALDNQLRPENIDRMFVGIGLLHPEEAKDAVRRRVSAERAGVQAQLDLLRQERSRFQSALASSDLAIQRWRLRLSETGRP